MTLADLAAYVCLKVNQSEARDLAACKGFLKRRFEMIWADQLWHDSLAEYTQTLDADGYDVDSTWLPTKQTLILPKDVALVIAVRTDTRKMGVVSSEELYRVDFNTFENSGTPTQYRILAPCVWEFDTVKGFNVSGSDDDADKDLVFDYLYSVGNIVKRVTIDVSEDNAQTDVLRIDSVSKVVTTQPVTFSDRAGNGTQFLQLLADDLLAPKRQRIQLLGAIADETPVRVLAKTVAPTFSADNDEPALNGIENSLLAFAQADMLQRERQYGKAQVLQQEGQLLLEQLKKVRTVQMAHNKRLIPESGYGDELGLLSGSLGTL